METAAIPVPVERRRAETLLDALDSLPFARWVAAAHAAQEVNETTLRRVISEHRLELLEWRVRDAVETILWYRAPRHLRLSRAAHVACASAARAVVALAVDAHLSQRERDDLYGFFMRSAGLA